MKKTIRIFVLSTLLMIAGAANRAMAQSAALPEGVQIPIFLSTTTSYNPNALLYLPKGYHASTTRYPLVVFFNGDGERGPGIEKMRTQGLPLAIEQGKIPYSSLTPGDTTWFAVLSIQTDINNTKLTPVSTKVLGSINTFLDTLSVNKIDMDRIYLTALSSGNGVITEMIKDGEGSKLSAAYVSLSISAGAAPATKWNIRNMDSSYLWSIMGVSDIAERLLASQNTVAWINEFNPGHASESFYNRGHCCWELIYDPAYKDTNTTAVNYGKSIYDFMLEYHRNGRNIYPFPDPEPEPDPENDPPTAVAGADRTITLPKDSVTLDGSASLGQVDSYTWRIIEGVGTGVQAGALYHITGLTEGYVLAELKVENANGATKDTVRVTILPATGGQPESYRIYLGQDIKYFDGDTVFYQINNPSAIAVEPLLFDEQDKEVPTTKIFKSYASQRGYPYSPVIDLGGMYKITKIQIYGQFGNTDDYINIGSPTNWTTDTTFLLIRNPLGWANWDVDLDTRYLKLSFKDGTNAEYEMRLYGYALGDTLSRVPPVPYVPKFSESKMGDLVGFNFVGPKEVDSVGNFFRHYNNFEWLDTVRTEHDIDKIKFVFSKFRNEAEVAGQPSNYYFPDQPAIGDLPKSGTWGGFGNLFDVMQSKPEFLQGTSLFKYIDTAVHKNRDIYDVNQYDRLARLGWTYGAFYGSVAHPADSMQTPYPQYSGRNKRKYVENGNEFNGTWKSAEEHYDPRSFTAFSSAFYDGNGGAMGNRMGVKRADPSMQVSMGGTAGTDTNYLKAMQYWAYYTLKNRTVPFDIVNFHAYPASGINGANPDPYSMTPEGFVDKDIIKNYIKTAKTMFPDKEIWLSEWGYDRHGASSIAVRPIPGKDSTQAQADAIARVWLMLPFAGVDKAQIFGLTNSNTPGEYDEGATVRFMTTGLTTGAYVGDKYTPGSGIYSTVYFAYPAYYFQRAIWLNLYDYKADAIVRKNVNDDSIYVYKFRNVNNPDSVAYAVWSGTQTNRVVNGKAFKVANGAQAVKYVTLTDKEFEGVTTHKTTSQDGYLNLVIDETPKIIFAKDISGGGSMEDSGDDLESSSAEPIVDDFDSLF